MKPPNVDMANLPAEATPAEIGDIVTAFALRDGEGVLRAACRKWKIKIKGGYLNQIRKGIKPPNAKILKRIGYRRVTTTKYVRVTKGNHDE